MKTLRLKIKREAYPWLNAAAVEVNQVWNYCNETSLLAATRTDTKRKWLTGFDLCNLTSGSVEHMEKISSNCINAVCNHFAQKRRSAKRLKLRWRVSRGNRRSLGWVPFKAVELKRLGAAVRFYGKTFRIFESSRLDGVKWRGGCFAQDSVGDWWLCLPVDTAAEDSTAPSEAVGIDLGLKAIATTSDGDTLEAGFWTAGIAERLAQAQRRGHKRQAKRLHRKAARRRLDTLHKFSRKIVNQYQKIIVGDVSSVGLARTRMAKSVLDSGWGMLKTQLLYKGEHAGRTVQVVNECNTTRVCSNCGQFSGPRGLRQLVVRRWTCDCGVSHDRDVNAARNILRRAEVSASVCGNERRIARIPVPAGDESAQTAGGGS